MGRPVRGPLLVIGALLVTGCERSPVPAPVDSGVPAAMPGANAPAVPVETAHDTARVVLAGRSEGVAVHDGATIEGTNRIVLSFRAGEAPGVEVFYADEPVVQCGSGDAVAVRGPAHLVIRLAPADAHVFEGEKVVVTVPERSRLLDGPLMTQLTMTCDFEAQVEWVVGLSRKASFTAFSNEPGRVIVEFGP